MRTYRSFDNGAVLSEHYGSLTIIRAKHASAADDVYYIAVYGRFAVVSVEYGGYAPESTLGVYESGAAAVNCVFDHITQTRKESSK